MSRLKMLLMGLSMALAPTAWSAGTGPRVGLSVGWSRVSADYTKRIKVSEKYKGTKVAMLDQIRKGAERGVKVAQKYKDKWPEECELKEGVHIDRERGIFEGGEPWSEINDRIFRLLTKNVAAEIAKGFPCALDLTGSRDVTVVGPHTLRVGVAPYVLSNEECGLYIELVKSGDVDMEYDVSRPLREGDFCSTFHREVLDRFDLRVWFDPEKIPSHALVGEDTLHSETRSNTKDGLALQVSVGYNLVFRDFRSPVGFTFGADTFYEADFGTLGLKLPEAKLPVLQRPIDLKTRQSVGVVLSPGLTFGPRNRYTVFAPVTLDLTRYHFKHGTVDFQTSKADTWMKPARAYAHQLCEMNVGKGAPLSLDQATWKFGASAGLGVGFALTPQVSINMSWQHSLGTRNVSFSTPAYEGRNDADIERFGVQHNVDVSNQKVVVGVSMRL